MEGTPAERIVATSITYLFCSNLTESRLSFRLPVVTDVSVDYEQDDEKCVESIYGIDLSGSREGLITCSGGSIIAEEGKTVVFPNSMQHCVEPFSLKDPSKSGRRTILALFLVDPEIDDKEIHSTASVPPQQSEWLRDLMMETYSLQQLGPDLIDKIIDSVDSVIDDTEAKKRRLALMDERRSYNDTTTKYRFELDFDLCEH